MPNLTVVRGPDLGRVFPLTPGIAVLGRHSANALSLTDPRASRRHCQLIVTETGAMLTDLASGNGTLVNGQPIQTVSLNAGDRIELGDTELKFSVDATNGSHADPDRTRIIVAPYAGNASAILHSFPADAGSQLVRRPESANLAVLYETAHAIAESGDLDELLGKIVELIVNATGADHGCAMVRPPDGGDPVPQAVRVRTDRRGREIVVSRTVMDHVLQSQVGVLVADAAEDERFRGGESIARHRLREVLCVPLRGRHDTVGVLFLDTNTPGSTAGKFTEDHLRLAIAVAHQAALAIEESRAHDALLQAERLAAIGQTIAALSHHIKNIMQGVRFGSDMIRAALPEVQNELLTKGWRLVEKNQGKIDELIRDMLSFSKEREPLFETIDLNRLVSEVLEVVRGRAGELGVELEFVPTPDLGAVDCDPDGMHHAILNMVGNALEAVEGVERAQVTIRLSRDGPDVEIRIRDNGPGIPPGKVAEIFRPFISSKGSRGTGLGLPVSRKTLREHGGEATLESEPGHGTVARLRWPAKRTE